MDSLRPGETAYVRAGVYGVGGAHDSLWWTRSGTRSNPITISGYPGDGSRVILTSRVKLEGAYLRLRHVVVDRGEKYATERGADTSDVNVWLAGVGDALERSEVRNSKMSGIFVTGSDDKVLANFIHDNGRDAELDHGIYLGGRRAVVANNVVARNIAYGLQFWPSCEACVVTSNTFVHNGKSGVLVGGPTSGARVANNVSAYNHGYGIRVFELSGRDNRSDENLTFANRAGDYCIDPCGGGMKVSGVFTDDPLFQSRFGRKAVSYRLRNGSPGIDLGLPEYAPGHDFKGRRRPQGAASDMGAFER
jgi:Right handed beta helix region